MAIIQQSDFRIPPTIGVAYPAWATAQDVYEVWFCGYSAEAQPNQSQVWVANAAGDKLIAAQPTEIVEWSAPQWGLTRLSDLYIISESPNDGLGVIWAARDPDGLVNNVAAKLERAAVRALELHRETIGLDCSITTGFADQQREGDVIACHVASGQGTPDFGSWNVTFAVMIETVGFDPTVNAAANRLEVHERREAVVIDTFDSPSIPVILSMLEPGLYVERGSFQESSWDRSANEGKYRTSYNFVVRAVGVDL